jgi:hypothetical protein
MIIIFVIFVIFILLLLYNVTEKYTNEKYTAIIIEPRIHNALELVLQNFTENLDSRWSFVICHGILNEQYILNIINNKLSHEKHRIKLHNLGIENLTIRDYNTLFYSNELYDLIPTEMFLVFQTDTLICKKYKNLIYDYMKYDYVGAPWTSQWWNKTTCNTSLVGNGGLSLRRKSKMLELLNNCNHNNVNEDLFFSKIKCNCKYNIYLYKPTVEEAKDFSVETIKNDKSFGVHKPWLYIDSLSHCEDLDKLVKYNKNKDYKNYVHIR